MCLYMMKYEKGIGLYGGTFDPLHNGHIRVVAKIKQLPFIEDLCIHVNTNPKWKTPMFPFRKRLTFCVAELDCNVIREEYDFTYQALRHLRKIYGRKKPIYYFVGKEWDISKFKNADYVKGNCICINIPPNEIKIRSTQIREMIKNGEPLNGLVPETVMLNYKTIGH